MKEPANGFENRHLAVRTEKEHRDASAIDDETPAGDRPKGDRQAGKSARQTTAGQGRGRQTVPEAERHRQAPQASLWATPERDPPDARARKSYPGLGRVTQDQRTGDGRNDVAPIPNRQLERPRSGKASSG